MTSSAQEPATSREFVKQSSLYQEFLAEREEILKHKWLESERLGYDIGFERALTDWIIKHRARWRKSRQQQMQAAGNPAALTEIPGQWGHLDGVLGIQAVGSQLAEFLTQP